MAQYTWLMAQYIYGTPTLNLSSNFLHFSYLDIAQLFTTSKIFHLI